MSTPSLPDPQEYFLSDLCRLLLDFELYKTKKVAAIRIYDLPDGSGLMFDLEFASGERPKRGDVTSAACTIVIETPHGTADPTKSNPSRDQAPESHKLDAPNS
jgi:hypothetical protein